MYVGFFLAHRDNLLEAAFQLENSIFVKMKWHKL